LLRSVAQRFYALPFDGNLSILRLLDGFRSDPKTRGNVGSDSIEIRAKTQQRAVEIAPAEIPSVSL
jgi:hypothetical protein